MEINRNQYFMVGIILVLIGVQLRMVDSFVLNEKVTEVLAKRTQSTPERAMFFAASTVSGGTRKVVHPPEWIGWCLMSIGSVLILHSLAMKRPGG